MREATLVALFLGALVLAGCGSDAGTNAAGTASAQPKPSKQGSTNAQAGDLQPPPNAPNPDQIMGTRSGG